MAEPNNNLFTEVEEVEQLVLAVQKEQQAMAQQLTQQLIQLIDIATHILTAVSPEPAPAVSLGPIQLGKPTPQ
jgi:hypothetical protein